MRRAAIGGLLGLFACTSAPPPAPAGDGSGGGTDATADSGDSGGATQSRACSTSGTPDLPGADGCVSAAPCAWLGTQGYGYYGYALDAGADVDGDGVGDVVLGGPFTDAGGSTDNGMVVLISGGAIGDADGGERVLVAGDADGLRLGHAVALAGDVNADGVADLAVGAPGAGGVTDPERGEVWLLLGGADAPTGPAVRVVGAGGLDQTGAAVAALGDMDGDGVPDLATNADLREPYGDDGDDTWSSGRACLAAGAALATAGDTLSVDDLPCWTGVGSRDAAGKTLAGGDLTGDGYADLVVASPYAAGRGRVYVVPGAADPAAGVLDRVALQLTGDTSAEAFGWTLAVGDVTGDGRPELAVGAPLRDAPWANEGGVTLYSGSDLAPLATLTGDRDQFQFGTGLRMGADVNGDGVGDLLVGSVSTWQGLATKAGRVYGYLGADTWSSGAAAETADLIIHGAAHEDYLGAALAAADLTGDGQAEILVSSAYTNHSGGNDVGSLYLFFGGAPAAR